MSSETKLNLPAVPWRFTPQTGEVEAADGTVIFDVDLTGATDEQLDPLGYVLAAAPGLYEALDALPLDAFDKDWSEIDAAEFVDHANDFMEAMTKARAAMARARGEEPAGADELRKEGKDAQS